MITQLKKCFSENILVFYFFSLTREKSVFFEKTLFVVCKNAFLKTGLKISVESAELTVRRRGRVKLAKVLRQARS